MAALKKIAPHDAMSMKYACIGMLTGRAFLATSAKQCLILIRAAIRPKLTVATAQVNAKMAGIYRRYRR